MRNTNDFNYGLRERSCLFIFKPDEPGRQKDYATVRVKRIGGVRERRAVDLEIVLQGQTPYSVHLDAAEKPCPESCYQFPDSNVSLFAPLLIGKEGRLKRTSPNNVRLSIRFPVGWFVEFCK